MAHTYGWFHDKLELCKKLRVWYIWKFDHEQDSYFAAMICRAILPI